MYAARILRIAVPSKTERFVSPAHQTSQYGTFLVPPQPLGFRHPLQRDRIRRRPERDALLLRQVTHPRVGFRDGGLQLAIHLLVRPAVLLKVLCPFVVADGHAAGVREEGGDHWDAALLEDQAGNRGGGPVSASD